MACGMLELGALKSCVMPAASGSPSWTADAGVARSAEAIAHVSSTRKKVLLIGASRMVERTNPDDGRYVDHGPLGAAPAHRDPGAPLQALTSSSSRGARLRRSAAESPTSR